MRIEIIGNQWVFTIHGFIRVRNISSWMVLRRQYTKTNGFRRFITEKTNIKIFPRCHAVTHVPARISQSHFCRFIISFSRIYARVFLLEFSSLSTYIPRPPTICLLVGYLTSTKPKSADLSPARPARRCFVYLRRIFFSIVVGRFTFHVRILYARIENILRIYRVTIVIFLCRSRFVEQTRVVKRAALFKCTVQIEIEFYV